MRRIARLLGWFAIGLMLLAAVPVLALLVSLPYQLIDGAGGLLGATGWPDSRMAFRVGVIFGGLASICMLLGLGIREMDARYLASAVLAALACIFLSALSIPWDPGPPAASPTGSTRVPVEDTTRPPSYTRQPAYTRPPLANDEVVEIPPDWHLPPSLPPGTNRPASVDVSFRNRRPPRYPREAAEAGISGRVVLRVHIDAAGRPAQVGIERSSGSVALDRAAMEAVHRWRFNPAYSDGEPIPAEALVPVDFRLD